MSFEPADPISVVTCERCQGKGCDYCAHQGVYGLKEDQPVIFALPDFIDFKARKSLHQTFLLKRFILFSLAALLIYLSFSLLS